MDWNGNQLRAPAAFVSRPETSFSFLYNYDHHYPAGTKMKHPQTQHGVAMMDKNNFEKKKRLTSEQLESLEMSFQEEIKLDPDRKMNIAQDLGLQPRQVAVWFQNKRARWKAKQLERLYDSLKRELDRVSREKHQLQEEVIALRAIILKEEAAKKHVSAGYTDISGEDTVESTSLVPIQSCNYMPQGTPVATTSNNQNQHQNIGDDNECNYVFNMDDYNPVGLIPYWDSVMPCYP